MIPTREQIEADWANPHFTPETTALIWLRAMRDEIDRLTDANTDLRDKVDDTDGRIAAMEIHGNSADHWYRKATAYKNAFSERDAALAEVTKLRADLDRANTEAALARDALAKATTPAPDREAAIRAWEKEALFDMYEHADDDEKTHRDDVFLVRRSEIIAAVALMRSAGDGKALLRELRAWIIDEKWCAPGIVRKIDEMLAQPAPSHVYSRGRTIAESAEPPTAYHPPAPVEIWPEEMKRQTLVGKFEPAPVEQPAAAVPDHLPDTGKMVPVLYWLEDGKFARAMLVGKDLLVVDLTFGDGPSVVGRPEWFSAGYVAAYGGLVPESATQGKEPGQWDYGVASIAKPSAVPDDTRELVAQLADLFNVHLSCNGGVNRLRSDRAAEIAAKLRRSK